MDTRSHPWGRESWITTQLSQARFLWTCPPALTFFWARTIWDLSWYHCPVWKTDTMQLLGHEQSESTGAISIFDRSPATKGWLIYCGIMHVMHNLRNPRCTACIKCRASRSDRPLQSCHIDHLFWNHGSSLTFVRGTLTDHFSRENNQYNRHDRHDRDGRLRLVMCTEKGYRRAYRGSYRTYRADVCRRLCMAMHMCRQTKSISVHAHVHICTQRICR
jgi:hypothetical protein